MWAFYRRAIKRMPKLAAVAIKRVDTITGWLTIIIWTAIGGTVAGAWWEHLPWEVPVAAFVVFFGYGFFKAIYQEHSAVVGTLDRKRSQLQDANTKLQARVNALESRPRTEAEQLKHDCRVLATELREFVKQREEEKQTLEQQAKHADTEEERRQAQQQLAHEESQHGKAHGEYVLLLRSRALVLLNAAVSRGWMDPGELMFVQGIGPIMDTSGMANVAGLLEQVANSP